MQSVCERMTHFIKDEMAAHGSLDTRELSASFTTDVVASSLFAVDSEAFTNPNSKMRALAKNVLSPSFRMSFILKTGPILPWLASLFKVRMMAEKEATFMTQLLRDTIKYRQENNVSRQDYTDFLLQLRDKKGLDEISMVAHAASFFLEGVETTSLGMTNLLYLVIFFFTIPMLKLS